MGSRAVRKTRYRPIDLGQELERSASWPRWAEKRGIIPPAHRDFSGFRYWTQEEVEAIKRTLAARRGPEPSAA